MKKLLLFSMALMVSHIILAQAPQWKSGYFKELNSTYIETASGTAKTIDAARNKAAAEIIRKRDMATGASATIVDGKITTSGELVVKSRVLDEYIERTSNGDYTVYILAQTAKNPSYEYEQVSITDEYPFSARAFVPGMEQIHKGQKTKGILFIAGEAACIGGIVVAESMRSSYVNLIGSTHDARKRATYTDNANTWSNVRTGFIAAAAAVYVWNIIDAVTSKGGRYVKVDNTSFALVPYTTPSFTGLTLNINF